MRIFKEYILQKNLYFSILVDLTNPGLRRVSQQHPYADYRQPYLSNFYLLRVLANQGADSSGSFEHMLSSALFIKTFEGSYQLVPGLAGGSLPDILLVQRRKAIRQDCFYESGYMLGGENEQDARDETFHFTEMECLILQRNAQNQFDVIEEAPPRENDFIEARRKKRRKIVRLACPSFLVVRGTIPLDWQYGFSLTSVKFRAAKVASTKSQLASHLENLLRYYSVYYSALLQNLHIVDLTTLTTMDPLERSSLCPTFRTMMASLDRDSIYYHSLPTFTRFLTLKQLTALSLFADSLVNLVEEPCDRQQTSLVRVNDMASHDRSMLFTFFLQKAFLIKWLTRKNSSAAAIEIACTEFTNAFKDTWQVMSRYENGSKPIHIEALTLKDYAELPLLWMDNLLKSWIRYLRRIDSYWFPYYYRNIMAIYRGRPVRTKSFILQFLVKRGFLWFVNLYLLTTVGDPIYLPTYQNRYTTGWGTTEWLFGVILVILMAEASFWILGPSYAFSLIKFY
jgi:hypothetical protein